MAQERETSESAINTYYKIKVLLAVTPPNEIIWATVDLISHNPSRLQDITKIGDNAVQNGFFL